MPYKDLETKKEYHKDYSKKYEQSEECKAKRKAMYQSEEYKAKRKAKYESQKNDPDFIAKCKARREKRKTEGKDKDAWTKQKSDPSYPFKKAKQTWKDSGIILTDEQAKNYFHEACNGNCKLCGLSAEAHGKRLFLDHDHKTGKPRQILCVHCNSIIGYFENLKGIDKQKIIDYLSNLSVSSSEIQVSSLTP